MQPLDLSLWPVAESAPKEAPYTTVIKWKPYGPLFYRGKTYGLKDLEFVKFVDLPSATPVSLELALEGESPVPHSTLREKGWAVRDAWPVTESLSAYRSYIHASRGEWCIAKNIYVETGSGWFSERSAVYLASGRPVVAQSTAYEQWLPTGDGLFSFSTADQAAAAFEAIEGDYTRHCRAARDLAETYFRAETVLAPLIATALEPPQRPTVPMEETRIPLTKGSDE
jgi:hypothetical protein